MAAKLFTALVVLALATFALSLPTTLSPRQLQAGKPGYVGYLFVHFYDDYKSPGDYSTYPAGEQVFGHLSKGNDPLSYKPLNRGAPLLTSTVGTKGVRDFYLTSKPDESKHYIIATDLNQTAAGGFGGKFLSRSLVIWESVGDSLVDWQAPRLVEVVPPEFRMAWAPEATWVGSRNQFMVYWASNKYSDAQHNGNPDSDTIYRAWTSDFKTFTPAEVYAKRSDGVGLIDMTIAQTGGSKSPNQFVRFTKLESDYKCFGEISQNGLEGPWTRIGNEGQYVDNNNQQEACELLEDNKKPGQWYVFVDQYGRNPAGYYPYQAVNGIQKYGYKDLGLSNLPPLLKHGSIKKLTQAQYDQINAKWG
ncbi:unnamed protein product [Parajaminaea phylloscopi]